MYPPLVDGCEKTFQWCFTECKDITRALNGGYFQKNGDLA